MLKIIFDWIRQNPDSATIVLTTAGLIGGCFGFILNIIINVIKNKKSKKEVKIKELTEENKRLAELNNQLTKENNYYKSNNIVEKTDGIDALFHKGLKIWICESCWYNKSNKISIVKDDDKTGYFRCIECGNSGVINKQIVEQVTATMNNLFNDLNH